MPLTGAVCRPHVFDMYKRSAVAAVPMTDAVSRPLEFDISSVAQACDVDADDVRLSDDDLDWAPSDFVGFDGFLERECMPEPFLVSVLGKGGGRGGGGC